VATGLLVFASLHSSVAQPVERCGGFPLRDGTTIGSIGVRGQLPRAASIEGLAAIVNDRDLQARGWIAWDEAGVPWLGLAARSPSSLWAIWHAARPEFDGRGFQVRFTALTGSLPKPYQVLACSFARDFKP